jgi:hypothetical protein
VSRPEARNTWDLPSSAESRDRYCQAALIVHPNTRVKAVHTVKTMTQDQRYGATGEVEVNGIGTETGWTAVDRAAIAASGSISSPLQVQSTRWVSAARPNTSKRKGKLSNHNAPNEC